MPSPRSPAPPPDIPGFEPVELIGSGGYADVFRYRQRLPERDVAVKVLVGDELAAGTFHGEANLMAKVSAHPYIVSIFEASITKSGRPYLVMEFYPRPNYQDRARSEHLSVPHVLQDGIRLAGAVETAHRAGILHRDLKPANVLTSEYGRPGLTDFGIATGAADDQGGGLSIPWAPPEALGGREVDERADVYSLAATVFHMLAGRSPFEQPGGVNTAVALMQRVERDPLPDIGRADVSPGLHRVLERAMSKDPAKRPESAAAFARALQAVEADLNLSPTPLEVPDVGRIIKRSEDDVDSTRVRSITQIDAQGVDGQTASVNRTADLDDSSVDELDRTRARPTRPTDARPAAPSIPEPEGAANGAVILGVPAGGVAPEDVATRPPRERAVLASATPLDQRPDENADVAELEAEAPRSSNRRWVAVGIVVASLVGVIAAASLAGGGQESAPSTTAFAVNDVPSAEFLDSVEDLSGAVSAAGVVRFEWTGPTLPADRLYEFVRTEDSGRSSQGRTAASFIEFDDLEGGLEVCLEVVVTAAGFTDSAAKKSCVTT